MNMETANSNPSNTSARCQHQFENGTRCRLSVLSADSAFCPRHARLGQNQPVEEDFRAKLLKKLAGLPNRAGNQLCPRQSLRPRRAKPHFHAPPSSPTSAAFSSVPCPRSITTARRASRTHPNPGPNTSRHHPIRLWMPSSAISTQRKNPHESRGRKEKRGRKDGKKEKKNGSEDPPPQEQAKRDDGLEEGPSPERKFGDCTILNKQTALKPVGCEAEWRDSGAISIPGGADGLVPGRSLDFILKSLPPALPI